MIIFKGKVRNMTFKELCLAWYLGRLIETIELVDFSKN